MPAAPASSASSSNGGYAVQFGAAGSEPFSHVSERILVKGGAPAELDVVGTRHRTPAVRALARSVATQRDELAGLVKKAFASRQ